MEIFKVEYLEITKKYAVGLIDLETINEIVQLLELDPPYRNFL